MILFNAMFTKKDVRDYKRLVGFIRPHVLVLFMAFLSMMAYSVLNGISPTAIIPVVDKVIGGGDITITPSAQMPNFLIPILDQVNMLIGKINSLPAMRFIVILLFIGLVYFILRNIFDFMQVYLMNKVSEKVVRDIKDAIYKKMLSLSMSFYGKNATAKLMSRITYDATIVRNSISTGLLDLILRPLEILSHAVVVILIVLFVGIPIKFLITTVLLFPCILLPAVIVSKRLRKITTRTQEKIGDINTVLFEIITGIRIVKAFSMQEYEYQKFKAENQIFYKLAMKVVKRINIISPINEVTSSIYITIVIYLASREVTAGSLSWGAFFAFLTSVLLMIKPVKRLSKVYAVIQQSLSAATRIFDILDTEAKVKDIENPVTLPVLSRAISFKELWFKYEDEEEFVLKNVNLEIKKGEVVAIVGSSGAGKTTLVNLIPRFFDPQKGTVDIDGVDIRNATLKSLRDHIGIVTQDMILFNDTVLNNISYGSANISQENVVAAAKIGNAHDFIMKLPLQYDTVIGEKGFRLSGGEKQRIAIARAIFKNPPILILDEATSQLDTESERYVQQAIDRLMEGRTVFAIAHRLSTVTHATKIIVFEGGKIVDTGTHKELMARGGLYKKLYDMQFRD